MTKDRSALDAPIEWISPKKKKDPFAAPNPGCSRTPTILGPVTKERIVGLVREVLEMLENPPEKLGRVTPTFVYTHCGLRLMEASWMCDAIKDEDHLPYQRA